MQQSTPENKTTGHWGVLTSLTWLNQDNTGKWWKGGKQAGWGEGRKRKDLQ